MTTSRDVQIELELLVDRMRREINRLEHRRSSLEEAARRAEHTLQGSRSYEAQQVASSIYESIREVNAAIRETDAAIRETEGYLSRV